MSEVDNDSKKYIEGLITRARKAQLVIETYSQEKVNELAAAVAWSAVKEKNAKELARLAMDETRLGDYDSKYKKILKKI